MSRYRVAEQVALRHWEGEETAVARLATAGTTHLIGVEALAVMQTLSSPSQGLALREIAHALGLPGDADTEEVEGLQRIIDGLIQSGLLCRVDDDDADPGRERSP